MSEAREIHIIEAPDLDLFRVVVARPANVLHTAPDCKHYSKDIVDTRPVLGDGVRTRALRQSGVN